ncbi:ABC transporter substrate-binding protein [Georgenia satyanarayanai]|uniref:ABC transporter substrate-binding protein n=1 Tax=Georgenia satyanarayanai TaxID=860221 RepID=UPI0020400513|nr:ABC transporter substrate-binding protein [Georgenia satyanarayanai]MCM3662075.1 ABC transporter substrate-binding protein [Georgenia satyanarayanai]
MRHRLPVLLALLLTLGACSSTASSEPAASVAGDGAAAFPRAVQVPAGRELAADEVTLEAEPERVAALTYETAAVVAELGAADRLVMVPEQASNPALSNHAQEMAAVEHHVTSESSIDAEAVIAAGPDLVVLNDRHGLEAGVGRVLEGAGIPVLVLPNTWASVEDMTTNIALVGEALGVEDTASTLVQDVTTGLVDESAGDGPRVLVLSNQAGRPFVTAGGAFPLEVLRLAGAQDASETLGMVRTGPISAEQVLAAEPDRILLVDMNGSGDSIFRPLLDNAAVAALPAVAEHEVLLLEGREVQALGLTATVEGRDRIAQWIAG